MKSFVSGLVAYVGQQERLSKYSRTELLSRPSHKHLVSSLAVCLSILQKPRGDGGAFLSPQELTDRYDGLDSGAQ